jgi:hypothetical protein
MGWFDLQRRFCIRGWVRREYHSGLFTFDVDNGRRNWVKLRLKRMRRKENTLVQTGECQPV